MHADDTHLTFAYNKVSNIDRNLNEDLSRVNYWLTANKLTLNTSKTEFMLIRSRQRLSTFDSSPSLEIDGAPISQVTFTKSLGVYIALTKIYLGMFTSIICVKRLLLASEC